MLSLTHRYIHRNPWIGILRGFVPPSCINPLVQNDNIFGISLLSASKFTVIVNSLTESCETLNRHSYSSRVGSPIHTTMLQVAGWYSFYLTSAESIHSLRFSRKKSLFDLFHYGNLKIIKIIKDHSLVLDWSAPSAMIPVHFIVHSIVTNATNVWATIIHKINIKFSIVSNNAWYGHSLRVACRYPSGHSSSQCKKYALIEWYKEIHTS